MTDQPAIKLLCLDLDGTMVESAGLHVWPSDDVVAALNKLGERGVRWCTNSGRSADNQAGMIQATRSLSNLPIAILSGERFIHLADPPYYVPLESFNTAMQRRMDALFPVMVEAVEPHRQRLREQFDFRVEGTANEVIGWNLTNQSQADGFIGELEGILRDVPDVQILRNGAWIILTHVDAGKGKTLSVLLEREGISPEQVLAIGDHLNDLDMLDGSAAKYVGCPADAHPRVKEVVTKAGGMVSSRDAHRGTLEIIDHYIGLD